jgi:hypothetical protein
MAVTIQYGTDLGNIVTNRSAGGRTPIPRGNHRGRVRHTSALCTLTADLDYVSGTVGTTGGDYDMLGLLEIVPDIRILNVFLKTSAGVGDLDLIAYNPSDPLETSKHVSLVEGLTDVAVAGADTAAAVLTALQAQWPFFTDNYTTKLVQKTTSALDEIDITAALPVTDGVSVIQEGTIGIGLVAGSGSAALASGETIQLNMLYSHE